MAHRWISETKGPFGMDLRVFGSQVPEGGSNCAKCKFVDPDGDRECENKGFIEWHGSSSIPRSTTSYCCNNFVTSGREVKPSE